jgi:myo-inositol-1(or 4)-monophosphatase
VNTFIINKIKESYPNDNIYSEESPDGVITNSFWSIDPIDGTSNFSRGIPHFAVVISYIENSEPIVGAIYNPITKELFSFDKNKGAYLNDKLIQVSKINNLKESFIILHIGRKEEVREWGLRLQKYFLANVKKNMNLGSSALDLAFLAAGRVDVVIYGTMTTLDIATAMSIVRMAGGEVYDIEGKPIELKKVPQQIIATANRELFEEVSKI